MKIEELLKTRGWSEADITAIAPMLQDARFRQSIEESFGAIATERDQLKEKDTAWQRQLDEQWQPRVTGYEQQLRDARMELAAANEKIKIAKDFGYIDDEAERKAAAAAAVVKEAGVSGYDPKKHPTWEDVQKFGEAEGTAIAMSHDLAEEYQFLTGKPIFEYETQINGQTIRGMSALRKEAQTARKNLDQYVADKFDFAGKRTVLQQKRQQDHDDAIRREEAERVRGEMAAQYGNPLLRNPAVSRMPFVPNKPADGKQPWERGTQTERRAERLTKLVAIQSKGAA